MPFYRVSKYLFIIIYIANLNNGNEELKNLISNGQEEQRVMNEKILKELKGIKESNANLAKGIKESNANLAMEIKSMMNRFQEMFSSFPLILSETFKNILEKQNK